MRRFFIFWVCVLLSNSVSAAAILDDGATLKGKVGFDTQRSKSWEGHELVIPFTELPAQLFEQVQLPPVPFPENWAKMKPEEQQKWAIEFEASDAGTRMIEEQENMLANAHKFEVKIEKDGQFVVFDVPPGLYGLRGRVDKEIGDTTYGFEIFGQIEIQKEMDEVRLDPIQVAVTPLLKTGASAPPVACETHNGKSTLTLGDFKDNYIFVNFWISDSPSAEYQVGIQKMYAELKDKYPLKLLSVCVDEDRKKAIDYIVEKKLKEGSHGFTSGMGHRTIFDYGIRTIPSFWLIGPDGKISMTQYDFARSFRLEPDLSVIVSNRIEGKDLPTPAETENDASK